MDLEVNSWDSAIRRARLKIQELKLAIETFEAMKESGEPFMPVVAKQSTGQRRKRQHSV